jgi:hypothetical protein
MPANPTYTLYLYESDAATAIAEGAVISVYPYGVSQIDANLVERETVQPGGTGTCYFNQLEVGGDYALVGDDGSMFASSFFQAGAARSGSVVSGATPPSGGGGGGAVVSTQIAAMCIGSYYEDNGVNAASGTQTPLLQSDVAYTNLSGAGLGTNFFDNNAPQMKAFSSAIPVQADSLRFELTIQATMNITPPGVGGYSSSEVIEVQLGILSGATGLSINGQQSFSDTVEVTSANNGQLVLSAKFVADTNVTGEPYIDWMPCIAVQSTTGDPLQINDLTVAADLIVTAYASVSS